MNLKHYEGYAPFILRLGLGFVFIWFGYSGLTNTAMWTGMVPAWTSVFGPAKTLVQIHGAVELLGGILLVLGIWIRPVAAVLLLSLLHTLTLLKFGPIMVRDIGLAAAMLSIFLSGEKK